MKTGTEVVLMYAIIPKADWQKVKLPEGCFAKAMEIGGAEELANMENCKGWGAWIGISLAKLGRKLCPEVFAILNPEPTRVFGEQLSIVPDQGKN